MAKIKISDLEELDVADYLDSEELIAEYLAAAMESGDPAHLVSALGDVARARGMTKLAKDSGLAREALYRSLSDNGNPSYATITKVMKALGLKLVPEPISA